MIINVCMDYLVGGAYVGMGRIARHLDKYTWQITTEVNPNAKILIYLNNNRFYEDGKKYKIPYIIQRKTGERSLKVPNPDDLCALICASQRSFLATNHPKKILIYNGIDFNILEKIIPKKGVDLLVGENRIGVGQRVDLACEYALKTKRGLHILGGKQNLHEDTYKILKRKYPMFNWVGVVNEEESLSYIKGCNAIIVSNKSHGCSNAVIESVAMNKQIINFGGCEIPPKNEIDIETCCKKYEKLIEGCK